MKRWAIGVAAALALLGGRGWAVMPDEQLADPRLEARARAIGGELRCVVCQNQTIDDSDADLARDLRIILRERLSAGDSDKQVIAYIVRRYGAFVLLQPPFETQTLLLWFGPLGVLATGAAGVALYLRRRSQAEGTSSLPLSETEREEVRRLLQGDPTPGRGEDEQRPAAPFSASSLRNP